MQSACGQSVPPSFRAAREYFGAKKLLSARFSCRARQCFCCKEVVIAHGRVARPLSMKLCLKRNQYFKEERDKNRIRLERSPVRKNAVQKFSGRSVHAPRSFL